MNRKKILIGMLPFLAITTVYGLWQNQILMEGMISTPGGTQGELQCDLLNLDPITAGTTEYNECTYTNNGDVPINIEFTCIEDIASSNPLCTLETEDLVVKINGTDCVSNPVLSMTSIPPVNSILVETAVHSNACQYDGILVINGNQIS